MNFNVIFACRYLSNSALSIEANKKIHTLCHECLLVTDVEKTIILSELTSYSSLEAN